MSQGDASPCAKAKARATPGASVASTIASSVSHWANRWWRHRPVMKPECSRQRCACADGPGGATNWAQARAAQADSLTPITSGHTTPAV